MSEWSYNNNFKLKYLNSLLFSKEAIKLLFCKNRVQYSAALPWMLRWLLSSNGYLYLEPEQTFD